MYNEEGDTGICRHQASEAKAHERAEFPESATDFIDMGQNVEWTGEVKACRFFAQLAARS